MLKEYYELLNPEHALIVLFAIITGAKISGGKIITTSMGYAAVMSFSIIAAAFILNDYWDFETDKANNRKDKPLVNGLISKRKALYLSLFFILVGNYASFLINEISFIITFVFTGVLLAYNYWLKKIALIGNMTIGLTMAIPFIYGNYMVASSLNKFALVLASMAFLMGTGREITASIRDKKGDAKQGRKTLPMIIGDKKSSYLSSLFIFSAIALSIFPPLMKGVFYHNYIYIILISITDIILLYAIKNTLQLKQFKKTRKWTLVAQLTGVLGFLLAVF